MTQISTKWSVRSDFMLRPRNGALTLHGSYPAGAGSAEGCSCIVNSPNLLKATPAAVKISPT